MGGLTGEPSASTVLVVDPHPVVRDGLPLLLRDEGLRVLASTGTPAIAETLAARHRPDVILLAGRLIEGDPAPVITRLMRVAPGAAVVLYAQEDEPEALPEAVRAGAAGLVSTSRPVAQLARALRAVAAGRTWFDEEDWVEAPLTPEAERSVRTEGLSESERRVLALVAAGSSTETIAEALGVSPHTVRTHVRNLLRKLDAQSRAHAVAIAMREAAIDV